MPHPIDTLVTAAADIAMRAAADYILQNGLRDSVDLDALVANLRAAMKVSLNEALDDARAAFECNMAQAAEATFRSSMVLVGIQAAKETVSA